MGIEKLVNPDSHGMSVDVSRRTHKVSLDVANIVVHLWMPPAGLQVSPAESTRCHWMWRTLWYVSGCLQQVSRCLQENPAGIIECREPCGMSLDISSRSPGVSSRIQEATMHVVNLMVCLGTSPTGLQQNPGGIIGCRKPHGISLDVSSRSPGVSSRIQEVSLDVANVDICLAKAPASLQVSPAESRRDHWM